MDWADRVRAFARMMPAVTIVLFGACAGPHDLLLEQAREAYSFKVGELPSAVVPVVRVDDGGPGDACWEGAVALSISRTLRGYRSGSDAEAFAAHDGARLYLHLRDSVSSASLSDAGPFGGDHWEVFFAGQREKPYRQLGISATGSVQEVSVGDTGPWASGIRLLFGTSTSVWSICVSLPLNRLLEGGVKAGDSVFVNILRDHAGPEPTMWSPIFQGGYHCPSRMGRLTLSPGGTGSATVMPPSDVSSEKDEESLISISRDCDNVDAPVKLLFPGGLNKALTLSYDDGTAHDRRLVSLLNEYGIRATFNVPAGALGQAGFVGKEDVRLLYAGHEVACHDGNPNSSEAEYRRQMIDARRALKALTGLPVRGVAFVGGGYDTRAIRTLPSAGIVYARTIAADRWFSLPSNPLEWHPTCHHNEAVEYGRRFLEFPGAPSLLYVWGHSYEFGDSNWGGIEEFCRLLGGRKDIWYATSGEIVDYLAAADRVCLLDDGNTYRNTGAEPVWLSVRGRSRRLAPGATVVVDR